MVPADPAMSVDLSPAPQAGVFRWQSAEAPIACVVLFLIGLDYTVHAGVTIGTACAVLTMPLWLRCLPRYRLSIVFCAIGAAAAVWGLALSDASASTHLINTALRRDDTVRLLGLVMAVGVILWAREFVADSTIGTSFGGGLLLHAFLYPGTWGSNAWKYAFAIPVAVVAISLAIRRRHTLPAFLTVGALSLISIALDSRAYSAALFLVLVLLFWRSVRPSGTTQPRIWVALLVTSLTVAVYFLATSLLVNGYLGADAQQRSIAQIDTSGSLILGGRPELAATIALIKYHPAGYGPGVVPSPGDVLAAKSGLVSINYAPNNGYVDRYMFGGRIELHSVFGDVWANWGLVGLALVVLVVFVVLRSVIESLADRSGNALTLYACCWTIWNIAFSPLVVSAPIIGLAVGLSLRRRRT